MKKIYFIVFFLVALAGLFGVLYFFNYLEFEKPQINLISDISLIGKNKKIEIKFSDQQSGIFHLNAQIIQDNEKCIFIDEKIPIRGIKEKMISLSVNAVEANLHDGPAIMQIIVKDHAFLKNQFILTRPVIIDTTPPQIILPGSVSYLNQGGTGFIAYRISKSAEKTGIFVNDYFTPAFKTIINQEPAYVVCFAVPIMATKENTGVTIFAQDKAGNETKLIPAYFIKEKKFRDDNIVLGKSFLQKKIPDFQSSSPQLQEKSLTESFQYINSQMRADNNKKIQNICQKSSDKKLWEGTFARMHNAATMARFGDRRTYIIGKKKLGNSVHLGVDLASTANAPVEAANNGVVVFAQELGIYGNTVIIDHGYGLFSLYAHLSSINTTAGKKVIKKEKIGCSGLTGLAGGDHLHFSILAGGKFVNPVEWWDSHWIQNNVNKKMIF